jgi:hypothetical protein
MQFVSFRIGPGALARLFAAAVLVAVVAVGAPLHSHDIVAIGAGHDSLQKSPCAACIVSASPGLVLERADVDPNVEAVRAVSLPENSVVSLSVAVRPGRAPPAV